MRILLDISFETLLNHGDNAMLLVAVSRLRSLWPDSQISIITHYPDRLLALVPDCQPVRARGSVILNGPVLGRWSGRVPVLEAVLSGRNRRFGERMQLIRDRLRPKSDRWVAEYVKALQNADLVVVPGGGNLTDSFQRGARLKLKTIVRAHGLGAKTALLGQGVGPVEDSSFRNYLASVLPTLDFIMLREGLSSPALLKSLGFPQERVLVTGDDAIELSYSARSANAGADLGLQRSRG